MTFSITRRHLLTASAVLGFGASLIDKAHAVLTLDVRRGNIQPIPIAISPFVGDPQLGGQIASVIENNLKRCGFFAPLDRNTFIEKISNPDQAPNFASWATIKADGLVTGRVTRAGDGRAKVEFRLWDIGQQQQLVGEAFATTPDNWRRVAHQISDRIFEKITGAKGAFDTRVVFIDETGPKEKRIKRLALMDQDGANPRYLSKGGELVVTPRFSPNSQDITYMAFAGGQPRVYLLNIETGQREVVGNFPGMTFAPRFAPDGQRILLSLQQGAGSSIYALDLRSKGATRLTDGSAIDTSPCFSPDSQRIVFESDRGGSQQLYVTNAGGSGATRISFGEGSYSTPVWSPRGDLIAFTKQGGGQFAIGVMKPDGSAERIITSGYHNEGPTWAPNGLFVMFFRDLGGGPQIFQADIFGRGEVVVPTPSYGSDPAWSPNLG